MKLSAPLVKLGCHRRAGTSVGAAVMLGLYGAPQAFAADPQTAQDSETLQEVLVTANRREQRVEEVPYNLSVVSGDDLASKGVKDLTGLTYQVPGLSTYDVGARFAGATSLNIRGINADGGPTGQRMAEQNPVGIYIGNSPVDGYYQLTDVSRIEVLRGPQGTLYGAGALGGALRIIPNAPKIGAFEGSFEASSGKLMNADHASYTATGMINVPLADTLAFRAAGEYVFDPGFINAYGLFDRSGNAVSGIPVLADTSDPVNSSGIVSGKRDWNFQRSFTGRASALWKPLDSLSAELAYVYARLYGDSSPIANSTYAGGPYSLDSRLNFPAGGNDLTFSAIDQPYSRRSDLTSLDVSYDMGFSTLSSTTSFATTHGDAVSDATYLQTLYAGSLPYYAGAPINPRFISAFQFLDGANTLTEELRLVSATTPDGLFDYVVGEFFENQDRAGTWNISIPGSPERSVTQGCTAQYYAGAGFPNCLVTAAAGDLSFSGIDHQHFREYSTFAELTWHFTRQGQLTVGGRHLHQDFEDSQSYSVYTFDSFVPATPRDSSVSKNIFKVNPSYEYASGQFLYATWSQGFRRGGASSVPLTGPFQESERLATYAPDSTNNYELGVKGRLAVGLAYTFDVFDINWDKPQIAGVTPAGNYAVWNANKARSRGFEASLDGPLLVRGLSFALGGAYSDAKLTADYSLPAGNGGGMVVDGLISGKAGSQLPGSPKTSATATLTYQLAVAAGYELATSLNGTYKSRIPFSILIPGTPPRDSDPTAIANLAATLTHSAWNVGTYINNLTDKRAILAPASGPAGNLYYNTAVTRPREIGIRLGYHF